MPCESVFFQEKHEINSKNQKIVINLVDIVVNKETNDLSKIHFNNYKEFLNVFEKILNDFDVLKFCPGFETVINEVFLRFPFDIEQKLKFLYFF